MAGGDWLDRRGDRRGLWVGDRGMAVGQALRSAGDMSDLDVLSLQYCIHLAEGIVIGRKTLDTLQRCHDLLEPEIKRRGLEGTYLEALKNAMFAAGARRVGIWEFMRATPEQKARAFLEAVRK
jgi:hypothetical protein